MGLNFAKKAGASNPAAKTPPKDKTQQPTGWMKRGKDARQALEQEEARSEAARAEQGKLFGFWMPEGEERRVTFLDGDLDEDGVLDVLAFYQHKIKQNGDLKDFVCTAEMDTTQPCPICSSGDKPSLVHAFTVIDHTPYKIQKGSNAGKTITNSKKIFFAKRTTMQVLSKLAVKRDGLAGVTFDISRLGDKSPAVGSQFDFVEKHESYEDIAAKYDLKMEDVTPADYEKEITYHSPDDLVAMGAGKAHGGVGTEKGVGNLKDQL